MFADIAQLISQVFENSRSEPQMPPLSSGTLYGETESSMQTLSTLVRASISGYTMY